jgi:sugar phosphate permease
MNKGKWNNVGIFLFRLFKVAGIAIGGSVLLINLMQLEIKDMENNSSGLNGVCWSVITMIFATFIIVSAIEQFGIKIINKKEKELCEQK